MSFRKRKDRRFQKNPTDMDGLMSDFMQRHGIRRQVTSALAVQKANELMQERLPSHAKADIKVISFTENTLKIAAKHAAAKHESSLHIEMLQESLVRSFPDITVERVIHVIDPKVFEF